MHHRTLRERATTPTIPTAKTVTMLMVMAMVMVGNGGAAAVSPSVSQESDLQRLWDRVTSHTETLRNLKYYLKQTDIFWTWFRENKGRLDEVLSEDRSSPSPAIDQRVLQRLDDLEQKQRERDAELQEVRDALAEEKEKTNRLEARLRQQQDSQDALRREIPKVEERMRQLEEQLEAVNETVLKNKRDIDGRVTADIHELQQNTDNLMERVDQSLSTSSDEVSALRELLQDVMLNTIFPLEDKVTQLNESQLAFTEETNQDFIDVRDDIRTLSARVSSKQRNNNGRGTQNQINRLQTLVSNLQGDVSRIDGSISRIQSGIPQQGQIQENLRRLKQLEGNSGNMNLEITRTKTHVEDLQRDVDDLKQGLKHVRSIRIPSTGAVTRQPIGPPGSLPSGSPSYPGSGWPGNQGLRGEPGDPGSRGAPGTPGAPGNPGPRGEQGSPGAPGGRGAPGSQGALGNPGAAGRPGRQGPRGAPGSPGQRGAPGGRGVPGSLGSSGVRGNLGVPGNVGPRGPPGDTERRGIPGAPGTPGVPGPRGAPGGPGYPGSPGYTGYPGSLGYSSASPAYSAYSASSGYTGYPRTSGYGGYYQG